MKQAKKHTWISIPRGFTFCRQVDTMKRGVPMKKSWNLFMIAVGLTFCLAGCAGGREAVNVNDKTDEVLVIYSPHPLEFINPIVSEFEGRTGIQTYVQTGGTGELLQMVEEQKEPACDIFWGGSLSTTMPKMNLFEPYVSSNEDRVRDEFKNIEGNMSRFTDIPSVLMVNTNLIGDISVEGYEDLLKPELKGKIAMCNPSTSSSAYEHLINMLYAMGDGNPEDGWEYVEAFCRNLDGILLGGSAEVYQGVGRGRFAVGLTFEEGAAHYVADGEPVKIIYMKEGVISKPDVVCIVKGSGHIEEAKAFVDFATGKDAQTVIADRLGRRSVREDVEEPVYLPDKDTLHMISGDEDVVNSNKKPWMERFSQIFQSVTAAEEEGLPNEHGGQGG